MRLILISMLVAIMPCAAQADNCKKAFSKYKSKLAQAAKEKSGDREITLDYLGNLEGLYAKCFATKEGKSLKAKREKLGKNIPPAEKQNFKVVYRNANNSKGVKRLSGGSAAMMSLVIPGLGQAAKDHTAAAWLFFLGATGCYAGGGALIASSRSYDPIARSTQTDQGFVIGGAVLLSVGGLIHVISVIHAAAAK